MHVGLFEAGQCVDRTGNGTIESSSDQDDLVPDDECILHADRGWGWRQHLSDDGRNTLWSSWGRASSAWTPPPAC